jgi:hypothetical protein
MDSKEDNTSNYSCVVAVVFIVTVTFLLSHFLTVVRGCACKHTDWWEGFTKYTVELGSGAMMHIPCFIKIGSSVQKLIRTDAHVHRQHGDHKPTFIQDKESRQKTEWPLCAFSNFMYYKISPATCISKVS